MKKSRFTESQIVAVLKEGEAGVPVAEILRKHGISRQTYFTWKSKYGGASVKDLTRLKELEQENAKLKRLYAVKDHPLLRSWRSPSLTHRVCSTSWGHHLLRGLGVGTRRAVG